MDVSFTLDLPPVPNCFSKLLVSETDTSPLPSQPWREAERLRELKDIMLQALAKESVPDTQAMVNGNKTGGGDDVTDHELSDEEGGGDPSSGATPFARLNSALCKLKREMVDLRHMDMSLFCQLLSLNEAIQDFKMTVNDRYSEYTGSEYTCSEFGGSEYSFGGMGSRVSSFSSLNEESEWNRDFREAEDPHSPLSPGESGDNAPGVDADYATSASSLLQQIAALTERAEQDFSV